MGLAVLLAVGALLALAASVAVIVRDARMPDRATVGWALARGLPSSPAEMGWSSAEGSFQCGDGTMLPLWTVDGGDPDGPALLMVHGWRRSRIDSLRRLPWLLPHVRVAVVPDLRGHGDAPPGPSTLGVQDVDDMLRAIGSHPSSAWVIAGHSLGADIALRVAAAAAERGIPLAGVLLMAPYGRIMVPLTARIRGFGLPAVILARPAAWVIRLLCGSEAATRPALATIGRARVPILLVAGDDDHIVPPAAVRAIAAEGTSASCDVTLMSDPDATHDTLGTGHPSWAGTARALVVSRRRAEATTSGT